MGLGIIIMNFSIFLFCLILAGICFQMKKVALGVINSGTALVNLALLIINIIRF